MSTPPEHHRSHVDARALAKTFAVVVGVGAVGSQVAEVLIQNGVRRMRLIDHDTLQPNNLIRHTLTSHYLGQNKATALKLYLEHEHQALDLHDVPRKVDDSVSDLQLDGLLGDADLIVAATDVRETQRRIGRRALALDIPAIFPGLYLDRGGEVFIQRSSRRPCFLCWDGHRPADQQLREVTASNADLLAVIQLASQISLAILDRNSRYVRELLIPAQGEGQPPQLFVQNGLTLARRSVPWRPGCPSCAVGPASHTAASEAAAVARPVRGDNDLVELRTNVWRNLTWTLVTLAVLTIICFVIINAHVREATALGLVLTLAILAGLWILYVNAAELVGAWTTYRQARRLQQRRR
jgi:molybdopterin/thiamine biosynthesis adenylyltransferase